VTTTENKKPDAQATTPVRTYYDGPADAGGSVNLQTRYFTYTCEAGLAAGVTTGMIFAINCPVSEVWPIFKDFNLWQNAFAPYYSGVVGDLEGKTFSLSDRPNDTERPHRYEVVRVIPEHLINNRMRMPEEGDKFEMPGYPAEGGVPPGFSVYMLTESGRATTILTFLLEHASLMERASESRRMSDEEAVAPWREPGMAPEWVRKWRDDFIPSLKRLVEQS